MSSPTNVIAPKTRKPTLPEKYSKFIQFAYYMMENVLGMDDMPGDERDQVKSVYLEKIKLFGTVEDQQAMVQCFFDNAKENKKTIRKEIADHKKALVKEEKDIAKAIAKENKQPRTKKTNDDGSTLIDKKPRKKATKKVVNEVQDELLNDLVKLAREETPKLIVEDTVEETPNV